MNTEKILELADFLEKKVTDEHFDIREWFWNHREGFTIHVSPDVSPNPARGNFLTPAAAVADCGTAACIAGWASVLWPNDVAQEGGWILMSDVRRVMNLRCDQGEALMVPGYHEERRNRERYSRRNAIATLRRLALTGYVIWPHELIDWRRENAALAKELTI